MILVGRFGFDDRSNRIQQIKRPFVRPELVSSSSTHAVSVVVWRCHAKVASGWCDSANAQCLLTACFILLTQPLSWMESTFDLTTCYWRATVTQKLNWVVKLLGLGVWILLHPSRHCVLGQDTTQWAGSTLHGRSHQLVFKFVCKWEAIVKCFGLLWW